MTAHPYRVRDKAGLRAALDFYLKRGTWNEAGQYSFQGFTLVHLGAIQTLHAAVEADVEMHGVLKRHVVGEALAQWYRSSRDPTDDKGFERALNESARSFEQRCRSFTALTLWNVRFRGGKGPAFEANGITTRLVLWSEIQDFALTEVWSRSAEFWHGGCRPRWLIEHEKTWRPSTAFVAALSDVKAPDWITAVHLVSHSQELVRAALNRPRAVQLGMRWSRLPTPLGDLVGSPVYAVFRDDRTLEDVAYGLEALHDPRPVELSHEELIAADALLRQLSTDAPDPEVARFKSNLLRLYQAALDKTDRQSQFFSFWQALERATLAEPGSREQVESRLATLLGLEAGSITSHLVRGLAALRHDLVHRGSYPGDDSELPFVMKWVTDHALERAFHLVDALGGVNALRDWFQHATQPNAALERLSKVVTHILRERGQAPEGSPGDPHSM